MIGEKKEKIEWKKSLKQNMKSNNDQNREVNVNIQNRVNAKWT